MKRTIVPRGTIRNVFMKQYWRDAGASFETMCDMLNSWIEGFGEGTNPKIKYKREKAIATGDPECLGIFEIS